jgi:hypothetical protein
VTSSSTLSRRYRRHHRGLPPLGAPNRQPPSSSPTRQTDETAHRRGRRSRKSGHATRCQAERPPTADAHHPGTHHPESHQPSAISHPTTKQRQLRLTRHPMHPSPAPPTDAEGVTSVVPFADAANTTPTSRASRPLQAQSHPSLNPAPDQPLRRRGPHPALSRRPPKLRGKPADYHRVPWAQTAPDPKALLTRAEADNFRTVHDQNCEHSAGANLTGPSPPGLPQHLARDRTAAACPVDVGAADSR